MQKVLGLHPTRSLYIGKHNASAEQMDKAVRLGKSNNLTTQQYKDGLYDVVREERKSSKDRSRALNKHKRPWRNKGDENYDLDLEYTRYMA